MIDVQKTSQILHALEGAKRIILLTHQNPDGDAIGSLLGMHAILSTHFSHTPVLCWCRDAAPASFQFLQGVSLLTESYESQSGDVLVILDTAEPKLSDFHESHAHLFDVQQAEDAGVTTIKVDHHPDGSPFGQLNIIQADAASTAEIVVELADELGFTISEAAATCLLTGLYTDTGSMMHSNTSARVYRTAARLLTLGADQQSIVKHVFRTSKLSTLRLWGRVLEHISLSGEGGAISAVTAGDFRATGADFSELTGAVDYVNSIPGMRFSLILSEREGKVKGSLRTLRDDVDVSAMARKFSGGGHKKAAGFALDGHLEPEVRWKVVENNEGVSS